MGGKHGEFFFIYISPICHNFQLNLEIGGYFKCPMAKFQLQTCTSQFQNISQSTLSLVTPNTSSCVLHIFYFFNFFIFFTFCCALGKVSIFNVSTFTNFDHNSQALNLLYHEMSLLFHQYFTFCDQMQLTVKKMW